MKPTRNYLDAFVDGTFMSASHDERRGMLKVLTAVDRALLRREDPQPPLVTDDGEPLVAEADAQ